MAHIHRVPTSQHVSTRMVPLMMTTPWCSSSPHCISRPRTSPRLSSGTTTMRSTGTVPHSGVFTTPCCTCSFHVNKTTTAILLVTMLLPLKSSSVNGLPKASLLPPTVVSQEQFKQQISASRGTMLMIYIKYPSSILRVFIAQATLFSSK